jgi:hypothetical protein
MLTPKYLASTFCVLSLSIFLLTSKLASQNNSKQQQEAMDFSCFPIVDFNVERPSDPRVREQREAKGRKYGSRNLPSIKESTDQLFSISDWDVRLPALPVEKSAAVLIGTITAAEAHLSPDKTGIYSEFLVAIESVLKNQPGSSLDAGRTVVVERNGGRVRMPSGKVITAWTSHQKMPCVGRKYLLFLTHDFETIGDTGTDFYILTGYELQNGRVLPLDNTLPGHPITGYKGASESTLLNDLSVALGKASNP